MPASSSDIAYQFGAAFLGVIVGAILFGISILQTFLYYKTYREDKIYYKVTVAILCFLDGLHLSFSVHMIFNYLVKSAGAPDPADTVVWSLKALGVVNVIIIWMVQCLYSLRVWQLSSKTSQIQSHNRTTRLTLAIVSLVAVAALAVGCAFIAEVTRLSDLTVHHWWLYTGNATSAALDTILASMMVGLLYRLRCPRERLETPRRVRFIDKVRFHRPPTTDNYRTTSLCSVTAIVMVILYAVKSDNLVYLAFVFVIPKLYVNSFIALLNARNHLRRSFEQSPVTIDLPNLHTGGRQSSVPKGTINIDRLEIGVSKPGGNLVTQHIDMRERFDEPLLIEDGSPLSADSHSP
ncbi:hypothetical protein GLOTRDRAFT_138688 [Gloeophyllum trabeum ATCC 11539]|uniref:DUF6534 domain-containing protein n=1 Tax=Gloeophyllum trabeum (strain ATCC 11539 / FP-39264 / Madison 617) TaxID=670483 RepID=S7Q7L4_GLOTA|nr:uncharacterized protein GLOTRDRAFT_138688 [Gloeophyllum trabeum ATCC 11539]EPQ55991.1 hypothetical protein GLOTRDRAFT_138688 [Gloeophyllum trabeum ATCC 11539]